MDVLILIELAAARLSEENELFITLEKLGTLIVLRILLAAVLPWVLRASFTATFCLSLDIIYQLNLKILTAYHNNLAAFL